MTKMTTGKRVASFDEEGETAYILKGKRILQDLKLAAEELPESWNNEDNNETTANKITSNKENVDKELLIDIVRCYPVIWQPRHPK